ncbi:MAG: SixA phosphatase family protein [Oceanipulchritudo sp.]
MKIFLLRHAPAVYGGPDPDRPLTESGKRMAAQLAAFTRARRYYSYTEIWCSPYLRARQTAEPFAVNGKKPIPVKWMDSLTPHGEPADLLPRLARLNHPVLIVGHNPHLSILAHYLLGAAEAHFPFKKGALWVFKKDPLSPSGYSLSACLPPASLGLKG